MDNRNFIKNLSERCGTDNSETQKMVDALAAILREHCGNMSTVALPAFGNFSAIKVNEHIASHPDNGKIMLYPPEIKIEFTAGSMLKKHIRNEQ